MQSLFWKLFLATAISGLSFGVCAQATYTAPASPSPSASTSSTSTSASAKVDADYEAAVSKCELQTGVDRNVCLSKASAARDNAMSSGQSSAPEQSGTSEGKAGQLGVAGRAGHQVR